MLGHGGGARSVLDASGTRVPPIHNSPRPSSALVKAAEAVAAAAVAQGEEVRIRRQLLLAGEAEPAAAVGEREAAEAQRRRPPPAGQAGVAGEGWSASP